MKVTTIGGGSGSFHLLLSLKKIDEIKINAIVSVSDNGGSTGILRTLYGILPPGDLRNCLVSLSEDTEIWAKIFNYRFDEKLDKHSLGNLILTALTQIYGSFDIALEKAHDILGIKEHKVVPVTFNNAILCAEFKNDYVENINKKQNNNSNKSIIVEGEVEIRDYALKNNLRIKNVFLKNPETIYPNPDAIKAILDSDFIVIGPGSLYTSIIPNFLVPEITNALTKTKAKKIYVCNIMTEPGETDHFKVEDFVEEIEKYTNLDYVIVNSNKPSDEILKKYYDEEKKEFVTAKNHDKRFIFVDLLNQKDILRHDPNKLSKILNWIFIKEKNGF